MAMHNSPKGRPVEVVAGQPDDVRSRGDQIVRLGGIMRSGYNTISDVLGSGLESDMEGEAIDSLAEVSREIHAELGLAATLYEEVGPYIRNYGLTLGEVKSRMTAIVPAADEAWRAYQGALADYGDAQRVPTPTAALSASPSSTQTSDAEQQRQDDIDELRWLFIAGGCTLTAIASPVGQSAALSIGVTVEDLLTALSVGDRVLSRSPDFDPEALVRVDETAQPRWSA
ncbi:hypothetical protein KZC51_04595 [Microbacterium sp. SSW1-49]|uniref:Uncharacterized protein n=1 Tax=Microbacterium croceum TaxID=2851645 RepID=A0ABT0FBG4_9MICO|nr:hypothetical protein [Microbacterium croceum]MCK2035410.1 hypothetical protein [Microbacterium croceum]